MGSAAWRNIVNVLYRKVRKDSLGKPAHTKSSKPVGMNLLEKQNSTTIPGVEI